MSGISELAGEQLTRGQRRQDEGCRVEETVQCLFSGRAAAECRLDFRTEGEVIRVVNAIRPPAGSRVSRIEGKSRIVSLTAPRCRNPGNLPTSQEQVNWGRGAVPEVPAASERQFVQIADHESMAEIGLYRAF